MIKYLILTCTVFFGGSNFSHSKEMMLVNNGVSNYKIVIPADASPAEKIAAEILQRYLKKISGASLDIITEKDKTASHNIYIGHTARAAEIRNEKIDADGFLISASNNDLIISGGYGRSVVYGVYTLLEKYLGCRKYDNSPAIVKESKSIFLPDDLYDLQVPKLIYRQAFFPQSNDLEYLEWHKLHKFEDLWGLWGHSFYKLVPPKEYFTAHPEYFALKNGKRVPTQLCLSNEAVFKITAAYLKAGIASKPGAIYWSVSPNDEPDYCTCDLCAKADAEEGSHSGALIRFVNRVAAQFPDQTITTLAYGFSAHPPAITRPAPNVVIMLSSIEAYRNKPLTEETSAADFINDLNGWSEITKNIFIWDYNTQFTNYVAPFPDMHTYKANYELFSKKKIKGVFAQGSGDTYSDWAPFKSYLLAKLLWDPGADINAITEDFFSGYYGSAGKYVLDYLSAITNSLNTNAKHLDIYGNPVNDYNAFLSPALIEQYNTILDKAEAAVAGNELYLKRVREVRLSIEFTVLQQSRFFGHEEFGYLYRNKAGNIIVKENWPKKVQHFITVTKDGGVKELSEGGPSPDDYSAEWSGIFKRPWRNNIAINAKVQLQNPFTEDYPAKRERTLVDAVPGYSDFSYNWLLFYGTDAVATVDLGKAKTFRSIETRFLQDARHWIFLPQSVTAEFSDDGISYKTISTISTAIPEEDYMVSMRAYNYDLPTPVTARYVRITGKNIPSLPVWRYRENKKPSIAVDEIYVQ